MSKLNEALGKTDWKLLAEQKETLVVMLDIMRLQRERDNLQGLINFIDAVQDAAEQDGFGVVFK